MRTPKGKTKEFHATREKLGKLKQEVEKVIQKFDEAIRHAYLLAIETKNEKAIAKFKKQVPVSILDVTQTSTADPFLWCCRCGLLNALRYILEKRNVVPEWSRLLRGFRVAALNGHLSVVKYLVLTFGEKLRVTDDCGFEFCVAAQSLTRKQILLDATRRGQTAVVRFLNENNFQRE